MSGTKPFTIEKRDVWEAFQHVDANQGAAGVDGQTLESFGERLGPNLYKLWNRMSSGSYMPSPVRRVMIPKADGGQRPLGIPTVTDRIAQGVVRQYLEPLVEPVFHRDSYGYRPERSAIDAIRTARRRCWRFDWVLDMDIKGFGILTDTGLNAPPSMPFGRRAGDAGALTGCWTWTSKGSLTPSIMNFCSRQFAIIRTVDGCCFISNGG